MPQSTSKQQAEDSVSELRTVHSEPKLLLAAFCLAKRSVHLLWSLTTRKTERHTPRVRVGSPDLIPWPAMSTERGKDVFADRSASRSRRRRSSRSRSRSSRRSPRSRSRSKREGKEVIQPASEIA
ncbi:unnamed protein product [Polarella glacialis]|uniref:Uncharacterized protein n=1 Tax=Polarella glacialis TaxID=89957 RepID=A0A813GT87_POLGL|nr:unnamed protein product [Polarella glacialis]